MRHRIILSLVSVLFLLPLKAQSIRISLFNSKDINSLTVNIESGRYLLKRNGTTIGEYKKGSIFHISRFGNSFEVRDKRSFIGDFKQLELEATSNECVYILNPVNPDLPGREYDDNLLIECSDNQLKLINKLDMEKYIAAVIEAEGGNSAPLEYYRAQAVLIRTFTIKNILKHAEEGFDLCDEVHCQAYKHRCSQHEDILEATRSTSGKVIIDTNHVLIMSPFHSNCGGTTIPASMVWQKDLPYLQSVEDPFCLEGKNATWNATLTKETWLNFIQEYTSDNIDYSRYDFSFEAPGRTKFILIHGINLNLRTVREQFGLRSAYFSIEDKGGSLLFKGRGYGHGVGMCQEGAMEMARVEYSWLDIIHFYFIDVEVADYREMDLHSFKPE